jgi:hypothetical protein
VRLIINTGVKVVWAVYISQGTLIQVFTDRRI